MIADAQMNQLARRTYLRRRVCLPAYRASKTSY
jgi:hypothetical protein